MATINIGGRTVEVPDNLDLPGHPARSLRNNVFGDAAAQTANPQTIAPPLRGDGPSPPWSQFESEVRARGNPWAGKPEFAGSEPMRGGVPVASPAVPPTLRERAAGAARTAGGFAIGAAAAYGGNKLAEAMSNAGNPGSAAPGAPTIMGSQAASQIPADGYPKAPPAQPYNFWTDSEAGRNLGNAAQAVAPLGGLAAAMKVPGTATRAAGLADAALVGLATGVNEQRQQAAPPARGTMPASAPTPVTAASTQPITFAPTDGPEQPSGARTNVLRVGNSYSGPEGVGGNISINNAGPRGTVNMLGGQPGDATPAERLAQIERDTLHAREMNGLRAQLMDRGAPPPGVYMFSGETLSSALRKQSDAQGSLSILDERDISAMERATLKQNERNQNLQAATTRRGQDMLSDTTRRGQDVTYAGQTRGQDIVADTTLRGQDMDLQSRILPKQMEIQMARQMRALRGQALMAAKGDPTAAAAILAQYGDIDGAKFMTEQSQAAQTRGEKTAAAGRDRLKHLATEIDPKTGLPVINEAKLAAVMHNANSLAPRFSTASAEDQAAMEPTITAGEMLRQGMNSTQNNSRWDNFWGNTKAERTKLDLRGAKAIGPVGMGWDAIGPRVSTNDIRLRLGDGTEAVVPRSVWDNQNVQELVAAEGKKPYRAR